MNKLLPALTSLILLASIGHAQDRIFLKNGDILSGKVLQRNELTVSFKSSVFGVVSLSTGDIEEIRLSIKEQNRSIEEPATILQDAEPVQELIRNPTTETTNQSSDLPSQRTAAELQSIPLEPTANKPLEKLVVKESSGRAESFKDKILNKDRWSGQTGIAIAMREKTSSNHNGTYDYDKYETYRFYGNVNWESDRNNLRWDWTYRYSRDEYRKRDDFFNIVQKYKHTFKNDSLYASAKTVYQRDYNRRIENEYLQTAEMGVKWFDKDSKIQLSTSAGGGYHMYERLDSSRTESTSVNQPKFIFDESLRWQLVNSLTLIQKYTHLGDLDDYHLLFSAGVENKLVQDLFLRLEYRLDRDTEVLYDDRGYYDKALLTSLLYKF